jgi:tight adherence protein C
MGYAILAFLIIFLLVGSGLLLMFYRELLGQRLAAILEPGSQRDSQSSAVRQVAESIGVFGSSIRKAVATGEKEASVVRKRLVMAGYRREQHVNVLYAARFIVPMLLCVVIYFTGIYHWSPVLTFLFALVIGYLAPDYWLTHQIAARETDLRFGLPDTLDLLVVCLEAGLSLDQAVLRAADELSFTHPAIADELGLVMLEVRAGKPRVDAWRSLTERTDESSVRMLVSILIQSDQFGTGISRTLRIHSDTMRTQRKQRVEEMAAKTTVKLVFPLALLIFPSVMLVAVGSAFIQIGQLFHAW